MNFEVLCFVGSGCVNKEYFDTYEEAREFERAQDNSEEYDWVSITPMNDWALSQMP